MTSSSSPYSASASIISAASSSSSSLLPSSNSYSGPWKYDVFLSFRGETRNNFTSHLRDALCKRKIKTFIDNKLERGKDLSVLLKAIENSAISIIVFSENFADSEWCLDEVVKIVECMNRLGQTVLPVFYRVDPSDVQEVAGNFGKAIAKHEEDAKQRMDEAAMEKVGKWKEVLPIVASRSGWNSGATRPDSKLVKEIVKDVLEKLHHMSPSGDSNLVGIDFRIWKIESLLSIELNDVRVIGIWGMPGVGKTTIAKALFKKLSRKFDASYFLENVSEKTKKFGLDHLQYQVFSKILEEENLDVGSLDLDSNFRKARLLRKKVLIVLDDVDDSLQLEELFLGGRSSFGLGSRIIITSRDCRAFEGAADRKYFVEKLDIDESLQLFCTYAFKEDDLPEDRLDQSMAVVNYCKGNPLALKVLGSTLYGQSSEDWECALQALRKVLNPKVLNVLRTSYDKLGVEEQKVFLDIACFFRGEKRGYVERILGGCYHLVHFTVSSLVDKCLLTLSGNKLEMHDLLQEMGWVIVQEESEPGKCGRIWNPEDVYNVLTRKKGTEAIESIFLDLSKTREMQLESDTFASMDHLKLLKFFAPPSVQGWEDKIRLPHNGLLSLSNELRYLHWERFPSKILAPNFCAEQLVEINLPYSKVEYLWTGKQHLAKLKRIDLKFSSHLSEIPDLSQAENIESINLQNCVSLAELHASVQHLKKLEYLSLRHCSNLRILPSRIDSDHLKFLDLSYCFNVEKCPDLSGCLNELDLSWTAVKKLPKSYNQTGGATVVRLIGCSNIAEFPEVLPNTRELYMSKTAIRGMPIKIEFLAQLERLVMINSEFRSPSSLSLCSWEIPNQFGSQIHNTGGCELFNFNNFQILMPGCEIPQWFGNQHAGSSVTVQFPFDWSEFLGIAFCVVFESEAPSGPVFPDDSGFSGFLCECGIEGPSQLIRDAIKRWECLVINTHLVKSDHLSLWSVAAGWSDRDWFHRNSGKEVLFKFRPYRWRLPPEYCKVKKCGVHMMSKKELWAASQRADSVMQVQKQLLEQLEETRMIDTSAADARREKDIQGIPWKRLRISREKYRQTRLEEYRNYENIYQSGARSEKFDSLKECKPANKGRTYYEFWQNTRAVKPTIPHFQLRNLVWSTSKHDVYLMSHFSIVHWSSLNCDKTEVLNVSGHVTPCEKHPGSLLEGFSKTKVSTLAVRDNLLVIGGFQGELICKYLDRPGVSFCSRTTHNDIAITNAIEIYDSPSGAVHFMASNNDCGVRDFDVERFQLSKHFCFPWPVNHSSLSPDRKLLVLVGDNPDGMLVDSQTGKTLTPLCGHLDYSFASAWHPDGRIFATGNQDRTCRVWDVRNLSSSIAVLKGNLGAIRSIRFTSDGQFMAMAEPADFVHVYDAKNGFEKEQEVDIFGEISGVSFSPDKESLFIGVCDHTYGSLLQYNRCRNYSYLDSLM